MRAGGTLDIATPRESDITSKSAFRFDAVVGMNGEQGCYFIGESLDEEPRAKFGPNLEHIVVNHARRNSTLQRR